MIYYLLVFLFSLLVDIIPFVGPPAWTVMVFFQLQYQLNVWGVLIAGVIGSTIGRLLMTLYIPIFSGKFINKTKDDDLKYLGGKLSGNKFKVLLFVFIYTLIPVPTTPLFTAIGMARLKPYNVIIPFFIGKFISDAVMVYAGKFAVSNTEFLIHGFLSWKTLTGTLLSICLILIFLFIDWTTFIKEKRIVLRFRIWK
jgi:membrane protein DedA with SNARE-associated domain